MQKGYCVPHALEYETEHCPICKQWGVVEEFKKVSETTKKLAEKFIIGTSKNYRTQISNLVPAIQAAAIEGFALRCVAAGSMWATFELTAEEVAKLQQRKIFLEEDK